MNKTEFYRWLHTIDWTTLNDLYPVNPRKYLSEYPTPGINNF